MHTRDDSKSLSEERYGRLANAYVTSRTHAKGAELQRLFEIAAPRPDWLVLDVATGGGHTARTFAPHVARVVATDLTQAMLDAAGENLRAQGVANVDFKRADAEDLPFDAATFDLVTCRIAPHHFTDCRRFVTECARVLKTPGLLLVQDHVVPEDPTAARDVNRFEQLRDPSHHRALSQSEWVGLFEGAKLRVTHTEQVIKTHEFATWTSRQKCSPETVAQLEALMAQATATVRQWMRPQAFGRPEATFVNRHLIIAGRKNPSK